MPQSLHLVERAAMRTHYMTHYAVPDAVLGSSLLHEEWSILQRSALGADRVHHWILPGVDVQLHGLVNLKFACIEAVNRDGPQDDQIFRSTSISNKRCVLRPAG